MFGITRAPDFDRAGLTWFNVERPLTLADLRGRLVILDFWTFCCINCFHVLPVLRRIEEQYAHEVAVIGIHSPKFEHERDPAMVALAIERYDVRHPVVHDPHMMLWQDYGVRAWPTLAFISPDGYLIGELPGEPDPDRLAEGIGDMIEQFWARGEMKPHPLPLVPPPAPLEGRLRFPGKIRRCPSADGTRLWAIADTGHHQVVVVGDDGGEVARYGSGRPGFEDGGGAESSFDGPEGLACDADAIYVADTRNHAIRRIDRGDGTVSTLAGIGCRGAILRQPEPGKGAALASPWDLAVDGHRLYFANAGTHQLGVLDLDSGMVRLLAGTGAENIHDGRAEDEAALAQPSGLALSADRKSLFFADSETSSVRRLRLDGSPHVETLVGRGLFEFGRIDGPLAQARLQHPLGLDVLEDGRLVVADSYNSALRLVDPERGEASGLDGFSCHDSPCLPWSEPAGIAADGPHRLLVSDTNNHRIVEVRLDLGRSRTWIGEGASRLGIGEGASRLGIGDSASPRLTLG